MKMSQQRSTSLEAILALRSGKLLGRRQAEAWELLRSGGPMTATEMERSAGMFGRGLHKRLSELKALGMVSEKCVRHCKISGSNAIVWQANSKQSEECLPKIYTRESEIQKAILEFLRAKGVLVWRNSLDGIRLGKGGRGTNPMKGFPDLSGCFDGRFFAIEVKRPGDGVVTDIQRDWGKKIAAAGGAWMIATSVTDVRANIFFKQLGAIFAETSKPE